MKSNWFVAVVCLLFLQACEQKTVFPKPRGYAKIDVPIRLENRTVQLEGCNYRFQYPSNAGIIRDTLFFDKTPENPCWMDIAYPEISGRVHISYKSLNKHKLYDLTEDYHQIKFKHTVKADFIDDAIINNPRKQVYGLASNVGGDVASAYQFYLTDSSKHFVRGALYFRAEPNADSLAPAVAYAKKDILNMFESWEWVGQP